MIKATAYGSDGKPVAILGLSGENMTRLMADEPIIVGGRTEEDIAKQLTAQYGKPRTP